MAAAESSGGDRRKPFGKTGLLGGALGILLGGGAVALWSEQGRPAGGGDMVRDYILANPEIIEEAQQRLADDRMAQAVDANRAAYETPYGSAWAGAEKGDVVLVEFFDYACSYCRASNDAVDRLLAEDKALKVVWRELPVLGPDSQAAAQVSLAAAGQGRFRPFYDQLFALGRPTQAAVDQASRAAGIAPGASAAPAQAEIEKNYRLAEAIRASGTPTFVVGDRVLHGAVGYDALKEAIAQARAS